MKVLAKPEESLTLKEVEKSVVNKESRKATLQDSKAATAVNAISCCKKLHTPDNPPGAGKIVSRKCWICGSDPVAKCGCQVGEPSSDPSIKATMEKDLQLSTRVSISH